MPIILSADETPVTDEAGGWREITLADDATFGASAMTARRLIFDPQARGPERVHGQSEQLLYVIRGSGTAVVDDQPLALPEESVLWLEPGERYYFVAGSEGLEILQGFTPEK